LAASKLIASNLFFANKLSFPLNSFAVIDIGMDKRRADRLKEDLEALQFIYGEEDSAVSGTSIDFRRPLPRIYDLKYIN